TLSGVTVTPVVDENGVVILTGALTDPGLRDTQEVSILWGDEAAGGPAERVRLAPDGTFSATHRYLDDARSAGGHTDAYGVVVTAIDNAGAQTQSSV
ncbi:hypothetical protein, partial [Roseixanthobacter liquoris]|uniref:hypothetical protein n=1 Tax=Roseixanthobacter liquoris TaxID=3119921 RepID=UPI003726C32A